MIFRKGNHADSITNDQTDNVVVEGVCTAEELVDLGTKVGRQTIEALSKMYPKNTDYEAQELKNINDEKLNATFKEASINNKEKIDAIYQRRETEKAIRETQRNIADMQKKAIKEAEANEIARLKAENEALKQNSKVI